MSFFDLVKDPEMAERVVEVEQAHDGDAPAASHDSALPVEIQCLRQRAQETDSRERPPNSLESRLPTEALVHTFLRQCLDAAAVAAENVQRDPPDIRNPMCPSILRLVTVPLIVGDWATVVDGREAAIEAVDSLSTRGFSSPSHRFTRDDLGWTLAIQFCY